MKTGTILILGCGWLGVPLGKYLIGKGFLVNGSVTSSEKFGQLRSVGISPYCIVLNASEILVDDSTFFEAGVLIISIPPPRIDGIEHIFPFQIEHLISLIRKAGIRKVIFISSTSVYSENFQTASEENVNVPEKGSGKALFFAENLLKSQSDFKTTILRFGGLIGAGRNPARFFLKSSLPIANTPVNLIHRDDCIQIISAILEQELWGETLNACSPEHPMKKDFYSEVARISGLPEPKFSGQAKACKIVDSSKLIRLLNYKFIYSNPMDYFEGHGRKIIPPE